VGVPGQSCPSAGAIARASCFAVRHHGGKRLFDLVGDRGREFPEDSSNALECHSRGKREARATATLHALDAAFDGEESRSSAATPPAAAMTTAATKGTVATKATMAEIAMANTAVVKAVVVKVTAVKAAAEKAAAIPPAVTRQVIVRIRAAIVRPVHGVDGGVTAVRRECG
jgi:hypothetical protein